MTKIVLLCPESGDWEALYVNEELIDEGHSLSVSDIFEAIQDIFPHEFRSEEIDDEKAEEGFSENLADMEVFIIES